MPDSQVEGQILQDPPVILDIPLKLARANVRRQVERRLGEAGDIAQKEKGPLLQEGRRARGSGRCRKRE